jgi:hypothetical protein
LVGCPFTPREAPQPINPNCNPAQERNCPALFERPITPEKMAANLERALRKVVGQDAQGPFSNGPTLDPNYFETLDSSFVYVPDPLAEARGGDCPTGRFFDNWNRAREVQFMRTVLEGTGDAFPEVVTVDVVIGRETGVLTGDERRFEVVYSVTMQFPPSDGNPEGRTECFSANALWDLAGVLRNDFTLRRWEDLPTPPDPALCPGEHRTLGILRAERGVCPPS